MADELDRIIENLSDELKDLTRVLSSTFRIFDTSGKTEKLALKQRIKIEDDLIKTLLDKKIISKEEAKQIKANNKGRKLHTSTLSKATTSVTEFGDAIGLATKGGLKELAKASVGTIKTFAQADKKVDGFGDALKSFDGNKLLGAGLDDIGRVLDFNVGIFKTLSQQGAGFGKSMFNRIAKLFQNFRCKLN